MIPTILRIRFMIFLPPKWQLLEVGLAKKLAASQVYHC
jgi:hypothetical protein